MPLTPAGSFEGRFRLVYKGAGARGASIRCPLAGEVRSSHAFEVRVEP